MSDAKAEVLKMIQAKRDKIRNRRRRVVRQEDYYNTVVDFVNDIDKATRDCKSFIDFDTCLNEAAKKLKAGIASLDPTANIKVVWGNNDDLSETWNELKVSHVDIEWSNHFADKNNRNKEETVDIGHLFLEGYFS
jgi:hypothetical protein